MKNLIKKKNRRNCLFCAGTKFAYFFHILSSFTWWISVELIIFQLDHLWTFAESFLFLFLLTRQTVEIIKNKRVCESRKNFFYFTDSSLLNSSVLFGQIFLLHLHHFCGKQNFYKILFPFEHY